jgi:protein-tyrosine phosphatase
MKITYSTFLLILYTLSSRAQIADSLQRKVNLQGAVNFRDLGGYSTKDGHIVKWGQVYRSADISRLTDQDLQQLQALKLALVCDLRGPAEIKTSPDRIPVGATYLNLPAGSETLPSSSSYATMNTDSLIMSMYSTTSFLKAKYKPMFEQLLALPTDKSMVFHCTAGKDRTGIGAALFLAALGVDRSIIIADYEATNYYWKSTQEKMTAIMVKSGMNESKVKAMLGANRIYIETFLNTLDKQYGSVDQFFIRELGFGAEQMAQLKSRYLSK